MTSSGEWPTSGEVAEYWIGEYVNVGGSYVNELVVVMCNVN